MSACCRAINEQFDRATVQSQLAELAKHGPPRETALLIEQLRTKVARSDEILDIGAGLGVVAQQLLEAGARHATLIDASSAYSAAARQRLTEAGLAEHVSFRLGDFLDQNREVAPADIVTLDKVICCYPDMRALVDASARKARRLYAASYPRRRWAVRIVLALANLVRRLRRNPFRAYVHPVDDIERRLSASGFHLCAWRETFVWRVVLFERRA